MRPAAALLAALLAAPALRADITVYPAGRVLAPSSELAPFAEGAATGGAFLAGTEGPGGALLNPAALGYSAYPYLAVSGVGPFNSSTEFTDLDLGYSQPLGSGALGLFLRDYRLGAYDLYDANGADLQSYAGVNGGSEFYLSASGAWRPAPDWSVGLGLGQGYTLLPGVGTYYRPFDWSAGSSYRWHDAAATALSAALRMAPSGGPWQDSSASAALGLERDLWAPQWRGALAAEQLWSQGWQGRAGLRWILRDGAFDVLAGAVVHLGLNDSTQQPLAPALGLNAQFSNLAGTLALSTGDDHSFQFTTELDWRFRPDAFAPDTLRGPDASRSYLDAGLKEQGQDHLPGALVLFSKAAEADPGNDEARRQRDDLAQSIATASAESKQLREVRAGAAYFSKLAEDYHSKGNLKEALVNFEWAIKVDYQNKLIYERMEAIRAELRQKLEALQGRAAAAEQSGDVEAAAKACHGALVLDDGVAWPGETLARLGPGLAQLRRKLYLQAVTDYVKASSDKGLSAGDRQQLISAASAGLQRALALDPGADEKPKLESAAWKCDTLRKALAEQ